MSDTNQLLLSIVTRLTTNLDKIDRIDDVLEMLEQCFLSLFKSPELQKAEATSMLKGNAQTAPLLTSATSIASTEESKLEITKAVLNFHLHARERHSSFLHSTLYHPHAALFIHELLKSLSGNSQLWFRALQIIALQTCTAIVQSIGTVNVRRCLPGIISATTKYIHRAHHGKDAVRVRLCAIELLHTTLSVALTRTIQEQKNNVYNTQSASSSTFSQNVSSKSGKKQQEQQQQQDLEETSCKESLCETNQDSNSVNTGDKDESQSSKVNTITEEGQNDKEASVEKTWMLNTIPHLHSALQSMLHASELCNSAQYDVRTLVALRELVIMLLSSSLMHSYLHTPLAGMLFASYHILTSLVQFNSFPHVFCPETEESENKLSFLHVELECCKDAQNALRRFLMELNGLELLHLATSILHHSQLRSLILTRGSEVDGLHECNDANANETLHDTNENMYDHVVDDVDSAVNTFLFTLLLKKCINVVKKTFTSDEYYSNFNYQSRFAQSLHCCVVNQFLISLAHALYIMSTNEPASSQTIDKNGIIGNNAEMCSVSEDTDNNEMTNGEVLTNILFAECEAILHDWYQYDIHAAVVYVLGRVVIWQFSWSIHVQCYKWEKMIEQSYSINSNKTVEESNSMCFLLPSWFVNDCVFDELWSVIGMPHLWNISADEELCSFEQLKHRQLVASTILRCLCLIVEHVFGSTSDVCIVNCNDNDEDEGNEHINISTSEGSCEVNTKEDDSNNVTNKIVTIDNVVINAYRNAFERFVTRTLYLVLEKAANVNHVHETAMSALHAYAKAETVCESMYSMNTYSSSHEHSSWNSKFITRCIALEKSILNTNVEATHNTIDKTKSGSGYVNENLHFILKYGHLIIDDAIRSAKVDELQDSAASILRGVVAFFMESIKKRKTINNADKEFLEESRKSNKEGTRNQNVDDITENEHINTNTKPELETKSSTQETRSVHGDNSNAETPSRLVEVVQSSLSFASIERKLSRMERLDDYTISAMATFLSASVRVSLECCQSIWENENYAMSQRTWQTNKNSNNIDNKMEFDLESEETLRSKRAALVLLCDSAHLAALLNFSTPLKSFRTLHDTGNESNEEDEDRQTTSSNVQVQQLQLQLLTAMDKLLSWFSTLDRLTSYAVRAIIEMLIVFLTTIETATETDTINAESMRKNDNKIDADDSTKLVKIVLPQSMLKVVYKVYLSFTSMFKEPIAALTTNTQKYESNRTAHEIRVLLAIPIRASLFSVLDGLHALLLLAPDFLIHRMVHEVMPLCLVWYEKVKRTRILTDTYNRLKHNIEEFASVLRTRCYKTLQEELEQICAPHFILTNASACHDTEKTEMQAEEKVEKVQ